MSDKEIDSGESEEDNGAVGVESPDRLTRGLSQTELDNPDRGMSLFHDDQFLNGSLSSDEELMGTVAQNSVQYDRTDYFDALKFTMAHLFEVICTEEEDVVREELTANKHLLDIEMVIRSYAVCGCAQLFETFPRHPLSEEDQIYSELIKEMIQHGACKCQPTGILYKISSRRLLDVAAGLGKLWLVHFLLDLGCEIDATSRRFCYGPLLHGIMNGNPEVVQALLSREADITPPVPLDSHILAEAVQVAGFHENVDNTILKILLESGRCDPNTTTGTPGETLVMAIERGNTEAVQMLLDAKVNPNVVDARGDSPLYSAVLEGLDAIVGGLIESGADVNAVNEGEGETALHAAVYTGYSAFVSLLLSKGAEPNKPTRDGYPPIVLAVDGMYPEILETLINAGAAVDCPGPNDFTALHNAAWDGHQECLEILLSHGAKPDELTQCKNTPLALAAHGRHLKALSRLMLCEGVNVNNVDKDQDTPLHYAAYNGCVEGVKLLLECGANPNVINQFKSSPLWNAVYMKHLNVVRVLVLRNVILEICSQGNDQERYNGADVVPLYPSQKSILWVAVERGCADIVDLLVEAGYNLWKEEWLMQNCEEGLPEESLRLMHGLQPFVQQAPSLMFTCRNFFRSRYSQSQLERLVETCSLPSTLKDFLVLKYIG